jgi:hypothetical protein
MNPFNPQIDMIGHLCRECKVRRYDELSLNDDLDAQVTCFCGSRVDRWQPASPMVEGCIIKPLIVTDGVIDHAHVFPSGIVKYK